MRHAAPPTSMYVKYDESSWVVSSTQRYTTRCLGSVEAQNNVQFMTQKELVHFSNIVFRTYFLPGPGNYTILYAMNERAKVPRDTRGVYVAE